MHGFQVDGDSRVIFSSDFLKITILPDNGFLFADWSGVLDADRARKGCTAVMDALKLYPHSKVLNNNSKVTGHYPGAIDWVGTVWFPTMYALGVRYFAWVYSPEFYTQIGTDQIVRLSLQVKVETFYSTEDAMQWLSCFNPNVVK